MACTQYVRDTAINMMGRFGILSHQIETATASAMVDNLYASHGDEFSSFVNKLTFETLGKIVASSTEGKRLLRELARDTLVAGMVEVIQSQKVRAAIDKHFEHTSDFSGQIKRFHTDPHTTRDEPDLRKWRIGEQR